MSHGVPCAVPLCLQAGLLLALNFIPLFEGPNWQFCRARNRCLTLLKVRTAAKA